MLWGYPVLLASFSRSSRRSFAQWPKTAGCGALLLLLILSQTQAQVAWDPIKKVLLTHTAVLLPACVSASASSTTYTCATPQPLITYTGAFISVSWIPDRTNSTQTPTL